MWATCSCGLFRIFVRLFLEVSNEGVWFRIVFIQGCRVDGFGAIYIMLILISGTIRNSLQI